MSQIRHHNIFRTLEKWAPLDLAYDWDNVGLQVGSYKEKTNGILVTLDVDEKVVDEAIEKGVNLIVAHHPLLFKAVKRIDYDTVKGRILQKIIANRITVYASHTNLDIAEGGVNDLLSEALQLEHVKPLAVTKVEKLYKLAVFTPLSHVQQVVDALSDAGAGHIGNYSHCTFQSQGFGTFKPLEGTNPFIGTTNKIEKVEEIKIETIVTEVQLHQTVQAMLNAHPYEEVAYDLYPLANKGKTYGIGRIGRLQEKMTLEKLIEKVKVAYNLEMLRYTGDLQQPIQKVAILGGSGEKFIQTALDQGADVLITGDITFHFAQEAEANGIALIDAGHYIEQIMKHKSAQYLQANFPDLPIYVSAIQTNPFHFR